MKKLLLSSIIMLGACGIASAQTDSKLSRKQQAQSTTAAAPAPTPQKAAIMPASDDVATPVTKTAADKQAAAAVAPSPVTKKSKTAQSAAAPSTVNAAGVVIPAPAAKQN